ncbi:nuclease [Streptomyces sp. NPDC001904]|uniref:ParB/RepB/Spo0J family partition protein n=1 Tax=Streptomyces sp. NPDC001904 TaxID=3154531 RepID=UPI00332B801F
MAQSNAHAVLITSAFNPARAEGPDAGERGEFDLKNFERLPARDVPLSALSPGVSLRQGGTDAAHIQLLADAAGAADLPPILVQVDGCRIIDGLHRTEAARLRGDASIRARFVDCSNAEALVIAMKANGSHGLPLCRADRLAGAQRVLGSHPDWSDRAIAGITGLSAKTVAALRERSGLAAPGDGKRIGQDGRRRPVDAGEGRRRAAEYITAHPGAPLRQVARETDVSLGTVHDVSARLRRGEAPEREGRHTAALRSAHIRAVEAVAVEAAAPQAAGQGPQGGEGERAPLRIAPAEPAPPTRRNHTDTPPTWAMVASKMAADPAVRYTAGGREFLRWMQLHAGEPGEDWRALVDAVPLHWLGVIAPIAEHIGREWELLAERLRSKQDPGRTPPASRP